MNINRIFYQLRKAGYQIVRLLPKGIRRYITPVLSIIGLIGFYRFMVSWTSAPMLLFVNEQLSNVFAFLISSTKTLMIGSIVGFCLIYYMVRNKIIWRWISLMYLFILVAGLWPMVRGIF